MVYDGDCTFLRGGRGGIKPTGVYFLEGEGGLGNKTSQVFFGTK